MGNQILRLKKEDAVLVGIDLQERLIPAMKGGEELIEACVKLVKGCRVLGVPVILTQQYTKGLGPTVPARLGGADRTHRRGNRRGGIPVY